MVKREILNGKVNKIFSKNRALHVVTFLACNNPNIGLLVQSLNVMKELHVTTSP